MVEKQQHITWRPPFRKPRIQGINAFRFKCLTGPSGWFQGYKDGGFEQ